MYEIKADGKASITIKNKYTTMLLPIVFLLLDYCAILSAETAAFNLRNFFVQNDALRISWLSFYLICPVTYIIFMQMKELYTRRMQFWRVISKIFHANIFATVAVVVMMYFAQIAGTTSRLFLVFLWILSFLFLVFFVFL